MILQKYKLVFKQLALLICLYAYTRLLFLVFNFSYFTHSESIISPFIYGIRFDLVVICWLNGLLFITLLLPFKFIQHPYFKKTYRIIFIVINALALLFNCIDIGYFEFIQKRSTFDLFQTLGGENDGMQLLPQYIADYWFVLLIWISVITALVYFSKNKETKTIEWTNKLKFIQLASLFCIFLPLLVIGSRGGW